jgi:hypothetical protein
MLMTLSRKNLCPESRELGQSRALIPIRLVAGQFGSLG